MAKSKTPKLVTAGTSVPVRKFRDSGSGFLPSHKVQDGHKEPVAQADAQRHGGGYGQQQNQGDHNGVHVSFPFPSSTGNPAATTITS